MEESITFFKYHGTGNDFILVDARDGRIEKFNQEVVASLCDRHLGIGADGLILLLHSEKNDFRMKYFNSDGKESTMCGNGGRCISAFARDIGIIRDKASFSGIDGAHVVCFTDPQTVNLKMMDVEGITPVEGGYLLNTGSPHFVIEKKNIQGIDVNYEGRKLRNNRALVMGGTNVNFMEIHSPYEISVRTYERGVENETLSCGTGSVASAIIACHIQHPDKNVFHVNTLGGKLEVKFRKEGQNRYTDVWLAGPAEFVFKGEVNINS